MVKPKKRTWRKAQVDDVEEAAEDERMLRKLKRKADTAAGPGRASGLFTLDTAGSSEGLSRRSKREIARAAIFPQKERKLGFSGSEGAKIERQLDRLHDPPARVAQELGAFDLWGSVKAMPAKVRDEQAAQDFHQRRMPIPLPKTKPETMHQKVGIAPAVIPAEEGQSLNPEQKAFEAVLTAAVDQQLERERKDKELDANLRPLTHALQDLLGEEKVASMDEAEKTEAYQRLVLGRNADAEGDEELPKKRAVSALKQKSQSFRNKNKRLKVVETRAARQKVQKKLVKQVGQIDSIVKELDKEEFLQKQRREARQAKKAEAQELERSRGIVSARRRIGRATFEEAPIPVPQTSEARGMRCMPVQPLAIKERFVSYSRRGMLPAAPEATPSQVRKARDSMKRVKKMRKEVPSPLVRDSMFVRRV